MFSGDTHSILFASLGRERLGEELQLNLGRNAKTSRTLREREISRSTKGEHRAWGTHSAVNWMWTSRGVVVIII